MRIRCQECQRKMEIDVGFAGGVCRCPFCQALLYVPQTQQEGTCTVRPAAPPPRQRPSQEQTVDNIPVATPVASSRPMQQSAQPPPESEIIVPTAEPAARRRWVWWLAVAVAAALAALAWLRLSGRL